MAGKSTLHRCQHGVLNKRREYFRKDTPVFFFTLISIIEDAKLLADIEYLTQFKHTGNLEVYHSVINKYSPKRLHFSL